MSGFCGKNLDTGHVRQHNRPVGRGEADKREQAFNKVTGSDQRERSLRRKRTFLFWLVLLAFPLALLGGIVSFLFVPRPERNVVPSSTACTDGFEVLVYDKLIGQDGPVVQALRLAEAEKRVSVSTTATFLVPPEEVTQIEEALGSAARAASGGSHPFVSVRVKPFEEGGQLIDLSFHESKCTYTYRYHASQERVRPISASFRGLWTKSTVTLYDK